MDLDLEKVQNTVKIIYILAMAVTDVFIVSAIIKKTKTPNSREYL